MTPPAVKALEARVAALERAVNILALHLPDAVFLAREEMDNLLERFEQRLAAAGTLARIALPEAAYDEAFAEWEALPEDGKARQDVVQKRKTEHLLRIGVLRPEDFEEARP